MRDKPVFSLTENLWQSLGLLKQHDRGEHNTNIKGCIRCIRVEHERRTHKKTGK